MDARLELEAIGIPSDVATELARLLETPPTGVLDPEDAEPRTRAEVVLRALLVASLEWRRFTNAIRSAVDWLDAAQSELSAFDVARFAHLRGLAAWRLDDSVSSATRALNASIRLLENDGSPKAARYMARVHDTFGQLLHQQGMLSEARRELEHALRLREAITDRSGLAITLGNLGRLCMDSGDFLAAADCFVRDLAIVEEISPERARVRAQLLSHLADCKLHLAKDDAEVSAADDLFAQSGAIAREAADGGSEMFAAVGRGRTLLARGDAEGALRVAEDVRRRVEALAFDQSFRSESLARIAKLAADAQRKKGDDLRAIELYREAARELAGVSGASPIERAEILWGLAEALAATRDTAEASRSLRLALQHLDGTAAESMRRDVEASLRSTSYDAWLLHSAGRFIGQQQIERLLSEAGEEGFRGARQRVIVMFSDIRGFTTMSERLSPEALILLLNDFLTLMTKCIEREGGMVDKFIGDAVMAIFPVTERPHAATNAICAALSMRDELERFNRRLAPEVPRLSIGIGLHGGEVIAGLIGSPQKRAFTVIGDVVNTAARLEGMTKQLGASVLATSSVIEAADAARFLVRPLGAYAPKGRRAALRVFDVMGERDRSPASRAIDEEIGRVSAALSIFTGRDFEAAEASFRDLERHAAGTSRETGYAFLASQARAFAETAPDPGWSGEITLTSK